MPTNRLLPEKGLPYNAYPPGETLSWIHGDNLAGFRQHGHAVYGEHDIQYKFNNQGYRCSDFDTVADVRVVAIGCSHVLGTGVAQEHLFHERFAVQLRSFSARSVVLWNLGRSAASNDYISRMLYLAVPQLDPHLVLINFTRPARREYISTQNVTYSYGPRFVPQDAIARDVYEHFAALSSPFEDEVNFFKNYKAVERLLDGRAWLYSLTTSDDFDLMVRHLDLSRYVGKLPAIDRARDDDHPGPESHKALAGLYWEKFVEMDRRRPVAWK
jgi:hypothetical protein